MLTSLRRSYSGLVTSGGQLALLFIGVQTESALGMFVCVALMAPLSLFVWISAWRRARAVDDTPTSRVASAAQGYTELIGTGKPLGGQPLLGRLSKRPCLWYRFKIEHRDSDNKWHIKEQGESDASFILDDGSGECVVDPVGAEILVSQRESWEQGDHRYTEWRLLEGQSLYVLGQFATRGSGDLALNANEDVKLLLSEWKRQPDELAKRFDLDGNGQLDMTEWALARSQAKREVAAQHRALRTIPETHVLHLPADGRLFLISDLDPSRLARKFRLWAYFHIVVFFASLASLPFLWEMQLAS